MFGDVNPRQVSGSGEATCGFGCTAAAQFEHMGLFGKPAEKILDPFELGGSRALGAPVCISRGYAVVSARDELLGIVRQTRSMTPASAWPKPMHIVATP